MKALMIVLDGIADRSQEKLGGMTPLQAADLPNLDIIARSGCCGHMYPLAPGVCASTDLAHWHMLGYSAFRYPGRAAIEALGAGWQLLEGEVVVRVNLATTRLDGGKRYVQIAPAYLPEGQAAAIYGSLAEYRGESLETRLLHLGGPFMILGLSGGASEEVTDSDPLFYDLPVRRIEPLSEAPEPAGSTTAAELERFAGWAARVLKSHPVTRARAEEGMTSPDHVLLKWPSRLGAVPAFSEAWGFDAAVSASGVFHCGLARLLGMHLMEPPRREAGGRVGHLDAAGAADDFRSKLDSALEALEAGRDFALVHTKAADEVSHTGRPLNKVRTCEALDGALDGLVDALARDPDLLTVVTADHATPSGGSDTVIHSGESVPLGMAGTNVRVDAVASFDEVSCASGNLGQVRGVDLMQLVLNSTDRARFASSRLTPCDIPYRPNS